MVRVSILITTRNGTSKIYSSNLITLFSREVRLTSSITEIEVRWWRQNIVFKTWTVFTFQKSKKRDSSNDVLVHTRVPYTVITVHSMRKQKGDNENNVCQSKLWHLQSDFSIFKHLVKFLHINCCKNWFHHYANTNYMIVDILP